MPGLGRKEISRLIPKKITDKKGRTFTVYVKPESNVLYTSFKEEPKYKGDPQYKEGSDVVKDKFYPKLDSFLGPAYSFKLHTDNATITRKENFVTYKIPLDLKYKKTNIEASLEFSNNIENAEADMSWFYKIVFPDNSNVRYKDFYDKHVNKKAISKLAKEHNKEPLELYNDIVSSPDWTIDSPAMRDKFHKYFTSILKS